jgi:hypothetical protein
MAEPDPCQIVNSLNINQPTQSRGKVARAHWTCGEGLIYLNAALLAGLHLISDNAATACQIYMIAALRTARME